MEQIMEMLAEMGAKIEANQAEMDANQVRLEVTEDKMETHQARKEANYEEMMAKLDAHHERMMACLGRTEGTDLEANPVETQSEAVHRTVPKDHAVVKSSGALKKRHRGRRLAVGRPGRPQERTRGNYGSRKKLVVAGRKMTPRAGVARRKVHIIRKNQTREKVARRTCKGRTNEKRLWKARNAKLE
jgi:hypothetical protein